MLGEGVTEGPSLPGKLLCICQDPMHRDQICSNVFCDPSQLEFDVLAPLLPHDPVGFPLCVSALRSHLIHSELMRSEC